MKNKLTDNDPRLTAYALGELTREEAGEIARMLDAPLNGPLQREVAGIDALGIMLTQTLEARGARGAEDINLKLSPGQRDAIFRSAKAPTVNDVSSTHQSKWLRPMLVTLGAAAVVTISFMVLDNIDSGEEKVTTLAGVSITDLSDDKLQAPIQPSNADWLEPVEGPRIVGSQGGRDTSHDPGSNGVSTDDDPKKLIELIENDWVNRADEALTRMPLACGKASWNWVKNSINIDGVLPDKNAVRVEEILNAFSYNNPSDLELLFTSAGVELVQCPWNSEHMIAVILVKNKHTASIKVEAAITFSESVEKYRLVGYAKAESAQDNIIAPAKITMGDGESHIVIYEIEIAADIEPAADVLSLDIRNTAKLEDNVEWITDEETLNVQFSDRIWTKAEQDVQFALILTSWSQCVSESSHDAEMDKEGVAEMISHFEEFHTLTDQQSKAMQVLKKGLDLL
ncbi:MAG: hypothetical protein ACJAR1_001384 [Rubritalea sp.]|jgi:hypothetical protein